MPLDTNLLSGSTIRFGDFCCVKIRASLDDERSRRGVLLDPDDVASWLRLRGVFFSKTLSDDLSIDIKLH